MEIPGLPLYMNRYLGLCECGCGKMTTLARQTEKKSGKVKNSPERFIKGHNNFFWKKKNNPNPTGICFCGCGKKTKIQHYSGRNGIAKGNYQKYNRGHKPGKITVECLRCKKQFVRYKHIEKRGNLSGRFCSKRCGLIFHELKRKVGHKKKFHQELNDDDFFTMKRLRDQTRNDTRQWFIRNIKIKSFSIKFIPNEIWNLLFVYILGLKIMKKDQDAIRYARGWLERSNL